MQPSDLASLPDHLTDEAQAWLFLERLRWQDGAPVCPHCGTKDARHYYLTAPSGHRTTRTGNASYRRIWKCRGKHCRQQFSVLVGTVFQGSKLPLSKWLLALHLCGGATHATSALELQRHLGVAYGTAWLVLHRIREAMSREPLVSLLSGSQADADPTTGQPPLQEAAAALLKVDPTGISGRRPKRVDGRDDHPGDAVIHGLSERGG